MKGVVKWFNKDKGFGFICPADNSRDIFVHYSDIVGEETFKTLIDGQNVEFEVEEGAKGPKAKTVVVVPGSTQ